VSKGYSDQVMKVRLLEAVYWSFCSFSHPILAEIFMVTVQLAQWPSLQHPLLLTRVFTWGWLTCCVIFKVCFTVCNYSHLILTLNPRETTHTHYPISYLGSKPNSREAWYPFTTVSSELHVELCRCRVPPSSSVLFFLVLPPELRHTC
jgi:hypothetical protein